MTDAPRRLLSRILPAPRRLAVLSALGGSALALAACGGTGAAGAAGTPPGGTCPSGTATVTAQGQGSAQGPPDLLSITMGVQTSAPSAAEALSQNSAAASALIARLRSDGVAEADIQTSGLFIGPVYGATAGVISSYQVSNTVTVRVHYPIPGSGGSLIDDAAAAAGNAIRVQGISFSLRNDSSLASGARRSAVQEARADAAAMAAGAGGRLGPLCSLRDDTVGTPAPSQLFGSGGTALAAPSTPVEPGTERVTAQVTAVYRLAG